MVAKKGTALNKSAEIRKAVAQYPDKRPAEIARMLTEQHRLPFGRKAVSNVKTKLGHRPAPARTPAAHGAAQKTPAPGLRASGATPAGRESVAAMVANLQAYIQRHGKQDLHRLIDTL